MFQQIEACRHSLMPVILYIVLYFAIQSMKIIMGKPEITGFDFTELKQYLR